MSKQIVHRATGPSQQLGPYGIETLIERQEEGAVTAYRVHIAPGERTAVSYHKVAEELYYVLSGSGTAVLDGQRQERLVDIRVRGQVHVAVTHEILCFDQGGTVRLKVAMSRARHKLFVLAGAGPNWCLLFTCPPGSVMLPPLADE